MNSITLEELSNIVPILSTKNTQVSDLFDYFRIVGLNNTKYEDYAKNTLYFLSYTTEEEVKQGWYQKPFDLRPYVNNIAKDYPNATFVIEKGMEDSIEDPNTKYIVVESIPEAINKLFEYVKSKATAKTISVTGSVGKTTAVGLIENILKEQHKVLRIYSKRITPIILKANIINMLTPDIEYVVLENSIYYHDHVRRLCELLPPDIACMLNIESSHLGIDKLQTIDDICMYKAEILKSATVGVINGSDDYLSGLNLSDGIIDYNGRPLFETNLSHLEKLSTDMIKVNQVSFIINNELKVKPFILTNLSKIQFMISYYVAKLLEVPNEVIAKSMNNYQPVENRLNTKKAFGKEIIFDGDITTYERMKELANSQYDKTYLVIRKVGSAENTDRIADIIKHFDKFEKVFLFDDIAYLDELRDHPKVVIVDNHDFMEDLDDDAKIIYHYSGYYRVWNSFNEENLNVYDNVKYKIIK